MQKSALRLVGPTPVNGTVPPRRKPNSETRDREHLTEAEVERLMKGGGREPLGPRAPRLVRAPYVGVGDHSGWAQ
jgi:type 1 fimbriae regulatory protein FimB/type 1 fimbriae regulatory protein FimE